MLPPVKLTIKSFIFPMAHVPIFLLLALHMFTWLIEQIFQNKLVSQEAKYLTGDMCPDCILELIPVKTMFMPEKYTCK